MLLKFSVLHGQMNLFISEIDLRLQVCSAISDQSSIGSQSEPLECTTT